MSMSGASDVAGADFPTSSEAAMSEVSIGQFMMGYMREIECEGYTTPYNESPLPGVLLVTMSTTTNRDTLQYESTGI